MTFFKTLNKALEEKYGEEGVQFDPFLLVLDEKGSNWVALKSEANNDMFSSEDSKRKI